MSQIIFDPATGLVAPDTDTIRAAVAQDWTAAFFDPDLPPLDTETTTPAGQLIDAETAEIEAKNAEILFLANQFNPSVSTGRWQDGIGYIYFITRKLAEPSVATCQVTGLNGTAIPYGSLAKSASGHTLICNRGVTIGASGVAETTFRCAETGPIEFPPNTIRSIVTTVPGWDTINNAAAAAVGRDVETRSEFEARRAASVAMNAHGSTSAIFGAIANIEGVLDVQVLENIGPNPVTKYGVTVPGHGITVCVYGGEDSAIAEAMYRKKDNGADTGGNTQITYTAADYANAVYTYLILRPSPVNFWVKVTLGPNSGITTAAVEALKQAILDDFYGRNTTSGNPRVGLASTVYASRFFCPAMSVDGIKNIQSIGVALSNSAPTAYANSVDIRGNQEPVLAMSNIIVVSP